MLKAYNLKIHGLVQGVFFRKHTKEKAIELGINGTVKNCPDGTVEVFAEGNIEVMEQFIAWCHVGPKGASVLKIDIHEAPLKNFREFIITH
jgi:acylphosphatase